MTGGSPKARGAFEVILFEETRFRGSLMFTSAEVTMGNDPGVMIRLDDPAISPCHALLRFDGETCTVENYDDVQGTLVNGVAVAQQDISPTDEIQIGKFRLRITVHKADATPVPVSVRPPARPVAPPVKPAPDPGKVVPLPVPAPVTRQAPGLPAPAASAKRPIPAPPPPPPRPAPSLAAPPPPPPPPPRPTPSLATPPAPVPAPRRAPSPESRRPLTTSQVSASAPTALAVAPPLPVPPARPVTPTPPTKPALTSVPASPAPSRTSTQSLVSRPSPPPARMDAFPSGGKREGTTGALAVARPSSNLPSNLLSGFPILDDDDEDAIFEPTFSLFDRLRESGASFHQDSAVEVVRFRHGCILKLRHLRRGEKLRLHGLRKPIGRCSRAGGFLFNQDALPEAAAVSAHGQPVDDAHWRRGADKRGRIALEPATQVIFPLPSGDGILVHLVPAAAPLPSASWRPRLTKLMVALAGVSVVVHLIVFAVLGLASLVKRDFIADNKEGRFARIALKEIELEPPAPPPKREKKKPKAETAPASPSEAPPKVATPHIPRNRAPSTPQTQSAATAQKLLSALGGLSPGPKPMSATAMSNLDAVSPVRGGGFKVSGAIGKLPGDSLRLAAAGSGIGRLDTKSTNDVGKNLGRVLGRAPTGQVRAQVTSKPNLMKVEGHLDRGEIQKVINAHIHELQGCFERQLVVNPNLAGKVAFEWVIGTSGGVTVVKIKSSTLSSNEATSCMQAAIRRWQFPAPSGGQVTVVYPIALANSGT